MPIFQKTDPQRVKESVWGCISVVQQCFDLIIGSPIPEPVLLITSALSAWAKPTALLKQFIWVTYKKLYTYDIDAAFWWPEKQPKCYFLNQDTPLCFTNALPILHSFQWSEALLVLLQQCQLDISLVKIYSNCLWTVCEWVF